MKWFTFYLDDTSAIEDLIRSDQGLDINARFADISDFRPIHLAAEMGEIVQ